MLKSLKKNQVVIYAIALMLVAAGYFNYTSGEGILQTSAEPEYTYKENLADIGDATLVNSDGLEEQGSEFSEQNEVNEVTEEANLEDVGNTEKKGTEAENTNAFDTNGNSQIEAQTTSANVEEYFSKSKLERDTMYSQMLETYQNIVNSTTVSEEQRSIATQEISNINNTKNAIMICENLLSTKGFERSIIFVNGDNVNIVVKTNGELAVNQVAQIQNIVSREMNVELDKIHISEKN